MDARKFFPVADRLRNSDDEADRRTSIGRSYYGLLRPSTKPEMRIGQSLATVTESHRLKLLEPLERLSGKVARSESLLESIHKIVLPVCNQAGDYGYTKGVAEALEEWAVKSMKGDKLKCPNDIREWIKQRGWITACTRHAQGRP